MQRSLLSRGQWRLVSMVAGLVLVFYMMQIARSPELRLQLERIFGNPPLPSQVANLDEKLAETGESTSQLAAPKVVTEAGYLRQVDTDLLLTIEDNSPYRDEETEAWFHLLTIARDASPEELAAASIGDVVYAQLLGQPLYYRGRVVSVDGIVRRVEEIKPAKNEQGIDTLFRVLIQPHGNGKRLFTLYCVELPPGWSAEGLKEMPMKWTGFFFKNWAYQSQQGIDLSPAFLSRSFIPIPLPVKKSTDTPLLPAWQLLALAVVAAGGLIVLIGTLGKVKAGRSLSEEETQQVADSLRELEIHSDTVMPNPSSVTDESPL